ncbi:hypothetical protein NP493_1345g00047 [Ridgeia piscesae]|uniref:Uncharacterized protein n=1 Tax=Ridgeia piscesae TaxID=27915 RepID=A0AAD9K7H7_RIDPI|nr:hypothetical protein NP493_1345g00047 [Ridgeia piscesae]
MAATSELRPTTELKINLDKLKSRVREYIDKHQYESALFWAEKAVTLSNGKTSDLFWYAQTMYLTGQYHRAAHLIKSHELDKKYLCARYLASKCHFEVREWPESLAMLDQTQPDMFHKLALDEDMHQGLPEENIESSINLLRGKIYESMENRNLAVECFTEALRTDIYCYEAFDSLVNHHMMTAEEEKVLLSSLSLGTPCEGDEEKLVHFLYEDRLKKYNEPSDLTVPEGLEVFSHSVSILVSRAERFYYNCHFQKCYNLTIQILETDAYNSQCLPLHIAVLTELKKANLLFYLAHKLVDLYPNKAVAWFAVGCYYLLVGKNDPARRYFSKATSLDRIFGPAWLAFGHSFAAENEHDQAMAAYFTAAQLMKGCHLPVLYIGLEYGLTSNLKLADRFFSQALTIAPSDPFVLHEIGVVAFHNRDYEEAKKQFQRALAAVQEVSDDVVADAWEPLLNNLGHVHRKLRQYDTALEFHGEALLLCPYSPTTLTAIGYVYTLTERYTKAVEYFHKALGMRKDDTFSTTMLGYALEKLAEEANDDGMFPGDLPIYKCDKKLKPPSHPASSNGGLVLSTATAESTPLAGWVLPPASGATDYSPSVGDDSVVTMRDMSAVTMGDSSAMAIDTDLDDS